MSHDDHGHSLAAWTAVILLIVAAALISLGIVLNTSWMWMVGGALVVVGVLAGMVMGKIAQESKPTQAH